MFCIHEAHVCTHIGKRSLLNMNRKWKKKTISEALADFINSWKPNITHDYFNLTSFGCSVCRILLYASWNAPRIDLPPFFHIEKVFTKFKMHRPTTEDPLTVHNAFCKYRNMKTVEYFISWKSVALRISKSKSYCWNWIKMNINMVKLHTHIL